MKNVEARNNYLAKREMKVLGAISKEERGSSHKPQKPRKMASQKTVNWQKLKRHIATCSR